MFGFIGVPIAKLAGVGTAAKAVMATAAVSWATESLPPTTGETEVQAESEASVTPPTPSTSAEATSELANSAEATQTDDIPAVEDVSTPTTIPALPALPVAWPS